MTFKGVYGTSICYCPDNQRMISGSTDKTVRQWDLKAGKEIEEARRTFEQKVCAVAVSRDGRWVVTGGGDYDCAELKAWEVETGSVKIFQGHSREISCIDISADNELLASGAGYMARIWNLGTGKLVAGPLETVDYIGIVQFSTDSKKVAVNLWTGSRLEVWDVEGQKLDVRVGESRGGLGRVENVPVFWTNKNKNIIAAFTFTDDHAKTIYEFNALTLEIVGTPFEGHTKLITGLALSLDGALLASAAGDETIKLWAFESRQLLASFDVQSPFIVLLSPDARQLAYTTYSSIIICNTPPDVLASTRKKATLSNLLNSNATRRPPAIRRNPLVFASPQTHPSTVDTQQSVFLRLNNFFHFARTNAVPRVQPRNPLDVPATLPLPSSLPGPAATRFNQFEMSSPPSNAPVTQFLRKHLSFLVPRHEHGLPVIESEVAPGRKVTRLAAAKFPEYKKVDDTRHPSGQQAGVSQDIDTSDIDSLPDVHWVKAFLCYYSCWSHGKLRMPPRWRLERVDIPHQDGTTHSSSGAHGRS
ncbi:YVTN repeat-like/Quino protein amine dehydrogenase [Suillus decipiens]|nr:YVTN repeat-like/Quino protein amine dehydrogenase [Suillus decipiens]